MNLFDKTAFAYDKAIQWASQSHFAKASRDDTFCKRAGFSLMACLAWHDKNASDNKFIKFFPYIKTASIDERNFVRKAVNWALRQIGKRNKRLNDKSIKLAKEILKSYPNSKSAQWIVKDALRELTNKKV